MLSPAEEAHAAQRQLLRQRGGKEETARLMGWSPDVPERPPALLACPPAVLKALTIRTIQLGHAELLSGNPPDKQNSVLACIVAQKVLVAVLKAQLGRYARRLCVLACDGLLVQYGVFVVEGARLLPAPKAVTSVGSYGCDLTNVHKQQPAFASFCCLSTTRCAADRHFWRLDGVLHRNLLILFVLIRSCSHSTVLRQIFLRHGLGCAQGNAYRVRKKPEASSPSTIMSMSTRLASASWMTRSPGFHRVVFGSWIRPMAYPTRRCNQ